MRATKLIKLAKASHKVRVGFNSHYDAYTLYGRECVVITVVLPHDGERAFVARVVNMDGDTYEDRISVQSAAYLLDLNS